jgi:hypothetical protein
MVKTKKDPQGVYQTNILARNTLTGHEERVTICRCPTHQKLWNLTPLTEKLESKSECKNLLARTVKGTKRFDEWELRYDPHYNYVS